MYMNGRGPMMGGHRGGPGFGGPVHHRSMGFRPMRVHRRPMGFFPIGGLFILPALMFGGWFAVAVVGGILSLAGSLIGGIFSVLSSVASEVFSGGGLVLGIILGLIAFYSFRNRYAKKKEENISTVDGEKVETEIVEPEVKTYRTNY